MFTGSVFHTQIRRLSIYEGSILLGNGIGDEEGDHSIR
jgi:hypothetical protein